jgi:tetratricopeptide (TPR) repeat protein
MARSTVFRYKGRHVDPIDVGRSLDVRAVLTGRALNRSDRLLIRVELVDALDGSHLWGEQYNRRLSDIFSIEEEISREISEKLRLRLTGAQKKQLRKRHTENTEAYQLYLQGRYYWNKRLEEALAKGIEYFERAISTDPNYALAYAGLADSYNLLAGYSALLPREAFPVARAAAMKALELDDTLAEAHTSLAFVKCWYEWDWSGAEQAFKRAISLNPGYATAHLWYSLYLVGMGRIAEAIEEVERAKQLDPLSLIINLNVARIHYFARDYDEAIALCKKTIDLYPDFSLAYRRLGQTYAQKHMYEEAISSFHKALSLSETDTDTMAALGHAYAMSGKRAAAEGVIEELSKMSGHLYVSPYSMSRVYMGLGDNEQTLHWLEQSYRERFGILAYLKVEPIFDGLRTDPRFEDLLRRIFSPSDSGIRVADFRKID